MITVRLDPEMEERRKCLPSTSILKVDGDESGEKQLYMGVPSNRSLIYRLFLLPAVIHASPDQ